VTREELFEQVCIAAMRRVARYIEQAAWDEQDAKRLEEEFLAMCDDEATQCAVLDYWNDRIAFGLAAARVCGVTDSFPLRFAAVSLADMLWAEFRRWVRR
jgi:hypothetical protein